MAPDLVHEVLQAELQRRGDGAFAEFDDKPVDGRASIGQVHRATLRDGRRVAVKIQYPGVAEAIRADLANTELVATFLRVCDISQRAWLLDLRPLAAGDDRADHRRGRLSARSGDDHPVQPSCIADTRSSGSPT